MKRLRATLVKLVAAKETQDYIYIEAESITHCLTMLTSTFLSEQASIIYGGCHLVCLEKFNEIFPLLRQISFCQTAAQLLFFRCLNRTSSVMTRIRNDIKHLLNDKASLDDSIPAEIYKYDSNLCISKLCKFSNLVWEKRSVL